MQALTKRSKLLITLFILALLFAGGVFGYLWWDSQKNWLVVNTEPQGAEVLIDGKVLGTTPLREKIRYGEHELTIKKDGYQDFGTKVNVSEQVAAGVDTVLFPEPDGASADGAGSGDGTSGSGAARENYKDSKSSFSFSYSSDWTLKPNQYVIYSPAAIQSIDKLEADYFSDGCSIAVSREDNPDELSAGQWVEQEDVKSGGTPENVILDEPIVVGNKTALKRETTEAGSPGNKVIGLYVPVEGYMMQLWLTARGDSVGSCEKEFLSIEKSISP